jgi:hypothetical protein
VEAICLNFTNMPPHAGVGSEAIVQQIESEEAVVVDHRKGGEPAHNQRLRGVLGVLSPVRAVG